MALLKQGSINGEDHSVKLIGFVFSRQTHKEKAVEKVIK